VGRRYEVLRPHLDERQRRLMLGSEAAELGRGGIKMVAEATGAHPDTVARGVRELASEPEPAVGVRAPGGGRKKLSESDSGLLARLKARASMVTTLTAQADSMIGWNGLGSTPSARPSNLPTPAAGSARTSSRSTLSARASPARPGAPRRSGAVPTVPVPPASVRRARGARCVSSAPRPRPGAASASASMRNNWPRREPGSGIRTGSPTTGPPDRRWNARSDI